jgi:hypothetical protein
MGMEGNGMDKDGNQREQGRRGGEWMGIEGN